MSEAPASWLLENVHLIPPGQPVLDVASGKGRNTLYLAAAGWPVHAIDRNPTALSSLEAAARARGLAVTTAVVDLETKGTTLGDQSFAAVLVFNYLHRRLMPILVEAVAPGGVLIYETFTEGQALRGHPRNPRFLLLDGELPGMVAPLEIVRAREGEFDGKLVSSIVATRL